MDGETYDLNDVPTLNRRQNHDISVVVDRLVVRAADRSRLNAVPRRAAPLRTRWHWDL